MFDRLMLEKKKLIDANQKLETEKEELIRSNYRLASNLTTLLQKNSELVEQIIREREIRFDSSFQAEELDINEDINSEDIKNINQLLQEFNSTKIQPLK